MNIQADTIEVFFAKSGEREAELRQLDAIIRESAPHLKPELKSGMSITMLGYGLVPYQTKSMKEPTTWPLIAIAPQKNYFSLYACVVSDGQYIAEKYEPKLGKVSCGKSCIRFKKLEDLNLDTVRELVGEIDERHVAGEKLFGM